MKSFLSLFSDSAKELKSVKCIVVTALLIALNLVLQYFSITVSPLLKIGFAFLANATVGMLFGPVVGGLAAGIGDVLGFFIDKTGSPFHPGFTIIAIVGGMIYGMFLYKREKAGKFILGIFLSKLVVTIVCNLIMTPYLLSTMSGPGYWAGYPMRLLKQVIKYPVDVILMTAVMPVVYWIYYHKKLIVDSPAAQKILGKFGSGKTIKETEE